MGTAVRTYLVFIFTLILVDLVTSSWASVFGESIKLSSNFTDIASGIIRSKI